jgi:hypothetical protein
MIASVPIYSRQQHPRNRGGRRVVNHQDCRSHNAVPIFAPQRGKCNNYRWGQAGKLMTLRSGLRTRAISTDSRANASDISSIYFVPVIDLHDDGLLVTCHSLGDVVEHADARQQ